MFYQTLIKHGNSLAVVIPAEVCRELKIHRGDGVKLKVLYASFSRSGGKAMYLEIYPIIDEGETID